MTKYPLSSTGVGQKLAELNTLTRSKLVEQSNLMRADFKTWLRDNFTLTVAQDSNISGWDNVGTSELGSLTADALLSNTVITYVPGQQMAGSIGKWTDAQKKKTVRVNGDGNFTVAETLVFSTEYY